MKQPAAITVDSVPDASAGPDVPCSGDDETCWLPVQSLLPAHSPRIDGEDLDHVRVLAAVETKLPPILVHRPTMRVIDGMHRLAATKLRNETTIEARYVEGTEQEAFVLAVKSNISHGRPLSLADRTRAAERIMLSYPAWSDRAIATTVGISGRLVATLRQRLEAEDKKLDGTRARVGRDGRVRPLDNAAGRLKAAEVIRDFPQASLREIGLRAGVSPATAGDVRKRIERGEDPVPRQPNRAARRPPHTEQGHHSPVPSVQNIEAMLQGLRSDPSLRLSEHGRGFLRWVSNKVLLPGEWHDACERLPPHVVYIMAAVARSCAGQWHQIATELDQRSHGCPSAPAAWVSPCNVEVSVTEVPGSGSARRRR